MYVLATWLTGSRGCGLVGAVCYAFCPFRFVEMSHTQILATGWLPIALYGLHRYFATMRRTWLVLFGFSSWFLVLSNSYLAYFIALPIAVIAVVALWLDLAL